VSPPSGLTEPWHSSAEALLFGRLVSAYDLWSAIPKYIEPHPTLNGLLLPRRGISDVQRGLQWNIRSSVRTCGPICWSLR